MALFDFDASNQKEKKTNNKYKTEREHHHFLSFLSPFSVIIFRFIFCSSLVRFGLAGKCGAFCQVYVLKFIDCVDCSRILYPEWYSAELLVKCLVQIQKFNPPKTTKVKCFLLYNIYFTRKILAGT